MEEKSITMADMVVKIIQENQISSAEEDVIWEMLGKRRSERIRNKGCRCLADFAEREKELAMTDKAEKMKDRTDYLHRRFIRETRIGNIDVDEVSDAEIRKLIILAAESGEMEKEDWLLFLTMVQLAVNAVDGGQGAGSSVFKNVFYDCRKAEVRIRYRKSPYTSGEMQKIMGWLDRNTDDVRALAVDLWLSGGITPEEIVGLRKDWLMDPDGVCVRNPSVLKKNGAEDYLPLTGRRGRIIHDTLKIQEGSGTEYIFMIKDDNDGGWKRMSGICLQLKLSIICRSIGYKPFKCTDAVLCRQAL